MRRPLAERYLPEPAKLMHIALVRLNDDLKIFINKPEQLNLQEMQKLCDIVRSLADIEKLIVHKKRRKKQTKQQPTTLADITEE